MNQQFAIFLTLLQENNDLYNVVNKSQLVSKSVSSDDKK